MQANRGISVKPLAAALTIALAAAGANAHAGSNGNPQLAARMQALHGLVAQLEQYRAAHPGKPQLFPHSPGHKIDFPRLRHAPVPAAATAAVTSCVDDASSATTAGTLRYAVLHRDIIARFGRFPHRNALLGRECTQEEQRFLDEGGFSG